MCCRCMATASLLLKSTEQSLPVAAAVPSGCQRMGCKTTLGRTGKRSNPPWLMSSSKRQLHVYTEAVDIQQTSKHGYLHTSAGPCTYRPECTWHVPMRHSSHMCVQAVLRISPQHQNDPRLLHQRHDTVLCFVDAELDCWYSCASPTMPLAVANLFRFPF